MLSFVVCQQQQLRTRVSPFWVATNSFGAFFELRHSGFSPLCPWQIFVRGCFCWALPRLLFCFASRLDGEAHIWLGDLRFAFCGVFVLWLFVLLICPTT